MDRAQTSAALKASDYKDLALWVALIRFDVLAALSLPASGAAAGEAWRGVSRLADSAIASHKDAWKASPELFVAVTLDHARALLRCGAVGDAKRALATLRSCSAAKTSWEFFKLLAIIECKQGACRARAWRCLRSLISPHPPAPARASPLSPRRPCVHPPRAGHRACAAR
jgi:hypothetical protein